MSNKQSIRTRSLASLRAEIDEKIKKASEAVKDPTEVSSIPTSAMVETTCTPCGGDKKGEEPKGSFEVTDIKEKGEVTPKKGENTESEQKVIAKGASILERLNKTEEQVSNIAANVSIEPDILRKVGMAILETEEGAKMAEKILRKQASAEYAAEAIKQASVMAAAYEKEMAKKAGVKDLLISALKGVVNAPANAARAISTKLPVDKGSGKKVIDKMTGKLQSLLQAAADNPKATAGIVYGVPAANAAGKLVSTREDLLKQAAAAGAVDAQAMAANPEMMNPETGDAAGNAAAAQGISPEIIMQAIDSLVQSGQISPEGAQQLAQLFASGGNVPVDMETLAVQLEQAIQQGIISEDQAMAIAQSIAGDGSAAAATPMPSEAAGAMPPSPPEPAEAMPPAEVGAAKTASEALRAVATIAQRVKTASVVAGEIAPEDEEATVDDAVETINALAESGQITPEEGQELLTELAGVLANSDAGAEDVAAAVANEGEKGTEEASPEEILANVTPEDVVESLAELVEEGELSAEEAMQIAESLDGMIENKDLDTAAIEEAAGDQEPSDEGNGDEDKEIDEVIAKEASVRSARDPFIQK